MRSFVSKSITLPVAFKAIPNRRRAQLWNRQASIITDLTTLAVRNGWCCLPISVHLLLMPSVAVISRPYGILQTDCRIKAPGNLACIEGTRREN
jgi:hypothetical protein